MTWFDYALCREADPALFALPLTAPMLAEARAVCAGCPVAAECLEDAFQLRDDATVRAGTTPDERRTMRRPLLLEDA